MLAGKFSLKVLLTICLIFFQFRPGVSYKIVAYKKNPCKTATYAGSDILIPPIESRIIFQII